MARGRPVDSKKLLATLGSERILRFGIPLARMKKTERAFAVEEGQEYQYPRVSYEYWLPDTPDEGRRYASARLAVMAWLLRHPRQYGGYKLYHHKSGWTLADTANMQLKYWAMRPSRAAIAAEIRLARKLDSRPSYGRPDTLGWRTWRWDTRQRVLVSPAQGTPWPDLEHRVPHWEERDAVRGHAGVHACRLPKGDWRHARRPGDMPHANVLGLVERFGKFVLGSMGWRAEWVIIRELLAPDEFTAQAIRAAYPDAVVHVAERDHWITQHHHRLDI